jgi:hypothetical protein
MSSADNEEPSEMFPGWEYLAIVALLAAMAWRTWA